MSKCIVAEYKTRAAAKVALEVLETDSFSLEEVSVVASMSDPAADHLDEFADQPQHQKIERNDGAATAPDDRSVGLGMLIGGTVAAPIAAGTLIGPFVVAGPLVGMALGAAVGGLLSSAERWGVHHKASERYEQAVRSGSVLILVNDEDETRLNDAHALLMTTDPTSLERFELVDNP